MNFVFVLYLESKQIERLEKLECIRFRKWKMLIFRDGHRAVRQKFMYIAAGVEILINHFHFTRNK